MGLGLDDILDERDDRIGHWLYRQKEYLRHRYYTF